MADFQKENDDWKNVLRSEIITALTGSSQEKSRRIVKSDIIIYVLRRPLFINITAILL